MNKNWYKLEFSDVERIKNQNIKKLETIVEELFDDQKFAKDVMVLAPKKIDHLKTVWIYPPKTVNLGIEKTLKICGAKIIPQPNINDVFVHIGDDSNIEYFFSDC